MDEYPSNSHKHREEIRGSAKEPRPKAEKVVVGEVLRRKKPFGRRFMEHLGGGSTTGITEYLVFEVAIPAAKDMFADIVTIGIERKLFGESATPRSRSRGRGLGHVSGYSAPTTHTPYNRYAAPPAREVESRAEPRRRVRALHDFDDIIIPTRVEAEEVLDQLFELISKYESATVADLYDMLGIDGDFTDHKYGWIDLRGAGVSRTRAGYLLNLPKPEPID